MATKYFLFGFFGCFIVSSLLAYIFQRILLRKPGETLPRVISRFEPATVILLLILLAFVVGVLVGKLFE